MVPLLEESVEDHIAGSPVDPDIRWTNRTPTELSDELKAKDHPADRKTIKRLLKEELGLGRRRMAKTLAMGESEDRDAQFRTMQSYRDAFLAEGWPVLSIDTKKKELLGDFYRNGPAWTNGQPRAWDHDFPSSSWGKVIPYGVYDLARNESLMYLAQDELPSVDEMACVLESAAGLTRYEAENSFSLSLVRHGCLRAHVVWDLKAQTLRKSGLVGLHAGQERFDQLGGLANLKAFCLRAMRRQGSRDTRLLPRGVLLLSPPGCGKSQFAKALGHETGRPTLTLDIGRLMGSLVGESERNVRQALRIADAMAPCVLFCDELDKGLSGVASSSQGDSGVSNRLFGSFLTWLSDHESDVFVVATANDISRLPPEFSRAERFDATFFVDLPRYRRVPI